MTPLLERTYHVRLPNGKRAKANVFALNMCRFADMDGEYDKYIQLTDSAWIRHRLLTIIPKRAT